MTAVPELGVVREVWLAKLSEPNNKYSFLIRDDAYSKSGVVFGRTIRLGAPVSLGPNGTWQQTTWEGGALQDQWSDTAMYKDGSADTLSERGKVKLWPALGEIHSSARANVSRFVLGGNVDSNYVKSLLIGESNPNSSGVPAGGFCLLRKDPGGSLTTLKSDLDAGVTAFSPLDDNSTSVYIGTNNGKIWKYDPAGGTVTLQVTEAAGIGQNSMTFFKDSLFYTTGNKLKKRYNPPPYTNPQYTDVFVANGSWFCQGLVVWNNRLWFAGITPSTHSRIYSCDGVNAYEAFQLNDAFEVQALAVHYGALYIAGGRPGADRTSWIGQVWRFNGGSLELIYQAGTGEDGEDHRIWDMATDRQFLAWTRSGRASNGYVYGLMVYDAETDSITLGHHKKATKPMHVRSVEVYDQTWVIDACADDGSEQYVRPVRKLGRMRMDSGAVEQFVLSSRYDGDIPGEKKVWLTGRVRVKVPQYTEVEVRVLLDEDPTERSVKTITYNGDTGYRLVTFPMKVAGTYLRSSTIQYKLYLRNTETANVESVANPVVDSVEIDFMPSPSKRRQWHIRAVCTDNQLRLDGSANPLSTADALRSKLEELWAAQEPILFWDAGAAGGPPSGAGIEVMPLADGFSDQSYRILSTEAGVMAEVSLSLLEVVQQ